MPFKLHWMPTLAGDVQAVLADGKVSFQNQEVALCHRGRPLHCSGRCGARRGRVRRTTGRGRSVQSARARCSVIREDLAGKSVGAHGARRHHNHIFTWQIGDKDKTARAFESAAVTVKQDMLYPRVHPCPLETCGCVASFDKVKGDLTVYITSQAPHVVRTVVGLLSSIPESKIRIISPDIGGGFGNKVGVYPGYGLCDRLVHRARSPGEVDRVARGKSDNHCVRTRLLDDGRAGCHQGRHHQSAAGQCDGGSRRLRRVRDPTKWPAGMFHVCTGSYAIPNAFVSVDGVLYQQISRRCLVSLLVPGHRGRVSHRANGRCARAEARHRQGGDPLRNFVRKEQFPYHTPLGLEYDSGDYEPALRKAMAAMDYNGLRAEQAERRKDPNAEWLMGIGVVTFTEIVGAGPSKMCDILGVGMFDSCEIRVHPDGSAIARMGTITQGQGHQTTYAQIIATEAGIPASVIQVEEGDTSTAPYGLGTYGSRSTPVAGAAIARASGKSGEKARRIAAHLLEVSPDDLEFDLDRFVVKGSPQQVKTMKEIAWAAYNNVPQGMEMGLETVDYYDPPNFTFPFGGLHVRARHQPLYGRDQGAALLRAR